MMNKKIIIGTSIAVLGIGGMVAAVTMKKTSPSGTIVPDPMLVKVQDQTADPMAQSPDALPTNLPEQGAPPRQNLGLNSAANNGVATSDVIVNGHALTVEETQALAAQYGSVLPGQFWYDAVSGLYGRVGEPPLGLLAPGHAFGPLASDASRGTTGVYVNGREITNSELALLNSAVGQVPLGSYWLDGEGNYGIAGSSQVLGNLYAHAGAGGSSGSGDNFWSSSFSAGNSNSDNTQGYVSVPGVGPVGYGM